MRRNHTREFNGNLAVEKIQVVGAGQMGSGIAQVAAQAGLAVHLADVDEVALRKGEFFFIAPPLPIPGGSGSPVNPIAIK